jgi:hypothetical protein
MKQMYGLLVSHPPPWDDLNNLICEDSAVQKKLSGIRHVLETIDILSRKGYDFRCVQQGSQWEVRTDEWLRQFPTIVGLFDWLESVPDAHALKDASNHSPSLHMTKSNDSGRRNPRKRKTQDDSQGDAASHESTSGGASKRQTRR